MIVFVVLGWLAGVVMLAIPVVLLIRSPVAGLVYIVGPGAVCGVLWLTRLAWSYLRRQRSDLRWWQAPPLR